MKTTKIITILFLVIINVNAQEAKKLNNDYYIKGCASCHGKYGEKRAFGRAGELNIMDEEEFTQKMLGYKNKTYGGQMQYFMTHFVKDLSENEIRQIHKQIKSAK